MSVPGVAKAYDHHGGRYSAEYESFDDLWRPFTAGVGPSGACFASLDGNGQAALAADAYRRLGSPEGAFALTARAWWARGTAP
jgi:hypothetical protein